MNPSVVNGIGEIGITGVRVRELPVMLDEVMEGMRGLAQLAAEIVRSLGPNSQYAIAPS